MAVDQVTAHDAVVGVVHDDFAGTAALGDHVRDSLSLLEVAAPERAAAVGKYHLPLASSAPQDTDRERVDGDTLPRV